MYSLRDYPYFNNLVNDLENDNIYFSENGLECLVYGEDILICPYQTSKRRVRIRSFKEIKFSCKRTKTKYQGMELDFFGGPTVYLTFENELLIFEHSDIITKVPNEVA